MVKESFQLNKKAKTSTNNIMKTTFTKILILLLIPIHPLWSQKGPVAAGNEGTGFGGTISFSIGQIDYISINSPVGSVSQGLQQAYEIYNITSIVDGSVEYSMMVYPNPAAEHLILEISGNGWNELTTYCLTDMHGRLLKEGAIEGPKTIISMEHLSAATYLLEIKRNSETIQSFKIIKTL